jgi:F-type H+-transporting ATPase subunit a
MLEKSRLKSLFIALLVVLSLTNGKAHASDANGSGEEQEAFNVSETIMHHIKDAHKWHLWGNEHKGTSIYLPIIIYNKGFKVFSSYHFYHGNEIQAFDQKTLKPVKYMSGVGPAQGYAIYHEKIYFIGNGALMIEDGHVVGNEKPLDLSITKNVVFMFLACIILCVLLFASAKVYRRNGAIAPKGIAKFIEPLVVFVRDDVAKENIDEHKYHKYVPYLLTIFFFILICNLLGSVPLIGANLTGNISVTLFLATCTLLVTLFSSNKNYWKHIFATPGVPVALLPIMIPIELLGIFTKPFALMIRLFANITAGHVIILALISIIFINKNIAWGALSVPMALFISFLELLVAFLQAYLFAMLSALFIGAAVEEGHH